MAWIESHQEAGGHPKTKRLARMLGISLVTAVGHLHFLWWWALDYAVDGDLSRIDQIDIAEGAMWEGDPDLFVSALLECGGEQPGFLEYVDDRLTIHDWEEYTGRLREQREKNAERQRRHRQKRKVTRDITVMSPLRNGATVPNRTVPKVLESDNARAREDESPTQTDSHSPAESLTPTDAARSPIVAEVSAFYTDQRMKPPLNEFVAEEITQLCDEFPEDWIREALRETARRRARSLRYVDSILSSWRGQGGPPSEKGKGMNESGIHSRASPQVRNTGTKGEDGKVYRTSLDWVPPELKPT